MPTTLREAIRRANAKGEAALIPFITAGDPSLEVLPKILDALVEGGADAIEIGIPFSDPIADGPIIQASSQRALDRGVTPKAILEVLKTWQNPRGVPFLLMTYINPVLRMGEDVFLQEAKSAGASGILITDTTPEEAIQWCQKANAAGIETIFLATPTSTDARIQRAIDSTTGFVYAVSRTGVTGTGEATAKIQDGLVGKIRAMTDLPVALGFGIRTVEDVLGAAKQADGVIVGSVLVDLVKNTGSDLSGITDFIALLKSGTALA
jgi:tryptophan synthase alpha chain